MKVFISYGDAADQVTALRLQALGAANDLRVYVPPAYTRQGLATLLDPDAAQKLNEAEVVLGIVGAGLSEACRQELFLFSIVLAPKAVRKELFKRRTAKDRLQNLFDTYAFFQRCDGFEQGTVDFLHAERDRQGAEDCGEIEAVVQASEVGATVIVDDPWGWEMAARDDLEPTELFGSLCGSTN